MSLVRQGAVVAALMAATAGLARAETSGGARFALIVGVNQSVDGDAPALRYADDDAAAYLDLFRALGARTYLLTRFDDNTRRLHPQAAAEAQEPRRLEIERVTEQLAADVAKARERHVPTTLYFIYAGHGSVEHGRGYLALEDERLYGADLERLLLDRVAADRTHFLVDACYSVFLALSRGPGGEREEVHGFSSLGGLAARPDVGLLLSTSSARESHEWSEFQAGVFSHEVRSGLLGAADVNRDGEVTYRELGAFIDRANAAVPNERFRPDVYVKEPARDSTILDLRPGLGHRLEMSGNHPGHYLLEDARGVRLADFNSAPGQSLNLVRLTGAGPLYLRSVGDGREYVVEAGPDVLRLDELAPQTTATQPRGAAHESFRLLFALPFSQADVEAFVAHRLPAAEPKPAAEGGRRRTVGFALLAAGAGAAAIGAWAVMSAMSLRGEPASQARAVELNQEIETRNVWAGISFGAAAAALGAGTFVLVAPWLARGPAAPTGGSSQAAVAGGIAGLVIQGAF